MKKIIAILGVLFALNLNANPGDTTWVQANNVNLNYYNNFDTLVHFPNGSVNYRKILMIFTLGEYACPSGSTYCHQWDYTVTNYVMTQTDTVELSRFITPYANSGVPRFPSTWKQHYMYDVTDFSHMLKDSATIRILYSGYSGGFTGNIKFAFIEGTPERNVAGMDHLWLGSYTFGNPADPISNHVTPKTLTAPANAQTAELKYTVTGHGSDNTTQCCEFASHTYSVSLNNSVIAQKAIWRDDCGYNELYAQGGTWIYDRANWCPGDAVNTHHFTLPGVTANSTYTLGVNYDGYTTTGNYGSYTMEGHVVYYNGFNHSLDASLDDIISPTTYEDHFRENPADNLPVVRVHNSGTSTINSITFSYGVKDSVATNYTWNGTLLPQQDSNITLAPLNSLINMSTAGSAGAYWFNAKIVSVNGVADEDTTNNSYATKFIAAPSWPTTFIVRMCTNSAGMGGVGVSPSETSWQIMDVSNNNVLASRTNANVSTCYNDTVTLTPGVFYKLTITDSSCDGLHWWVWDQNPSYGITAGSFAIKKLTGTVINMNGYYYSGTFNNDFGCGFTQNFTVKPAVTGIEQYSKTNLSMEVFPNPAFNNLTIYIDGAGHEKGQIELMDTQGKIVLVQRTSTAQNQVDLQNIDAGIYNVVYKNGTTQVQKRVAVVK